MKKQLANLLKLKKVEQQGKKSIKTKKYFLGIPIFKSVKKTGHTSYYFFGVKLFTTDVNKLNTADYKKISDICDYRIFVNENIKRYVLQHLQKESRIAVFGVLPPEDTGIAHVNLLTFGNHSNFDIFSQIKNYFDFCKIVLASNTKKTDINIYSIDTYKELDLNASYSKKIFVLGNSYHNAPYLGAAIEEKDKENSWLYLHEANLLNLCRCFFENNLETLKKIVTETYPLQDLRELEQIDDFYTYDRQLEKKGIYGASIIVHLTGIKNIIVNNEFCKKIVQKELKQNKSHYKIERLFLPLPDLRKTFPAQELTERDYFLIGSFGIPNDGNKLTNIVIEAAQQLEENYNIKSRVLLAGYNANDYFENLNDKQKTFCIIYDSPSDEKLFSLMKSVDVALQLRRYPKGESSGAVVQLLGMNQNIIVSKNFVDKTFEKYCTCVPSSVSGEELASVLKDFATKSKTNDCRDIVEKFSFSALAQKLVEL